MKNSPNIALPWLRCGLLSGAPSAPRLYLAIKRQAATSLRRAAPVPSAILLVTVNWHGGGGSSARLSLLKTSGRTLGATTVSAWNVVSSGDSRKVAQAWALLPCRTGRRHLVGGGCVLYTLWLPLSAAACRCLPAATRRPYHRCNNGVVYLYTVVVSWYERWFAFDIFNIARYAKAFLRRACTSPKQNTILLVFAQCYAYVLPFLFRTVHWETDVADHGAFSVTSIFYSYLKDVVGVT